MGISTKFGTIPYSSRMRNVTAKYAAFLAIAVMAFCCEDEGDNGNKPSHWDEVDIYKYISRSISIKNQGDVPIALNDDEIGRSIDGGRTWQWNAHKQIFANKSTQQLLTWGSSDAFFVCEQGFYASTNQGATWIMRSDIPMASVTMDSTNTLYSVEEHGGVMKSKDFGWTWESIRSSDTTRYFNPTISIDRFGTIFIGSIYHGLYRSTNKGVSWEITGSGLDYFTKLEVYFIQSIDAVTYASITGGFHQTTDRGEHWQKLSDIILCKEILKIQPDLLVGVFGTNLYFSKDNGMNWDVVDPEIDCHKSICITSVCVLDNGTILIGTSFGLYRSKKTLQEFIASR